MAEPFAGWIDTLVASGAILMTGGIGLMNYVIGHDQVIADLVPVDYCCNGIIACAAYNASKSNFMVVNCGSSFKNPVTWA